MKRLLSNTLWAFIGNVIVKASNTVLFIFIGRLIGPTEAGTFNLSITYFTIALALSAWGLHELLVREVAPRRQESKYYLVHYLTLRLLLSGIAYVILLLLLRFSLPYTADTKVTIRILTLAIFPESIFTVIQALFTAHERLFVPTLAALINGCIKVILGMLLLLRGTDTIALAWIIVLGSSASLLIFVPTLWQLFQEFPQKSSRFDWPFLWTQLRFTPGFIMIGLFTTLDFQIDALLISILLSEQELGYYGAAQTIMLGFWMMPAALRSALYPLIARYYYESPTALALLYQRTNRYILLLVLPICAVITLFSHPLIRLIFGKTFNPAAVALPWMIWAVVFSFLTVPNARLMLVSNWQQQAGWITGLSMVANLGLNLWLIPYWGITGAAIARTGASFLFFMVMYICVQRYLLRESMVNLIGRPLLATFFMTVTLWLTHDLFPLWSIMLGVAVYIIIIVSLKTIPEQDRQLLRQLIFPRILTHATNDT